MNVIEIYGTRRSGHHAVIGWLKRNFDQAYGKSRVEYLNDLTNNHGLRGNGLESKISEFREKGVEHLFLSYEDEFTETTRVKDMPTTKFVVIRDIYNNAASRYKAHPRGAMLISDRYVDIWIEHADFPRKIRYEDFISESRGARDAVSLSFGVQNLDVTDDVGYCSNIGSSFVGRTKDTEENYRSRWKMVKLPPEALEKITSQRVSDVRRRLGYEDIKIQYE